MTDSKGNQLRKVERAHFPDGPFATYSDGYGHYSVIGPNNQIILENELAADYCAMKCMELNKAWQG